MKALLVLGLAALAGECFAVSIWIEGEDASRKSVHPHSWYNSVKTQELSGGAWLSNFAKGDGKQGEAEYSVEIPSAGSYSLWLRANPTKSKMSLKIADADWTEIDTSAGWIGRTNVAQDGARDLRYIAWKNVRTVDLGEGAVRIALRMHSDEFNHGAIDALVLTTDPWTPSGITKPSTSPPPASPPPSTPQVVDTDDDGTTWAFRYGGDTLRDGSPIDLRRLNERMAGERGFITLTRDGSDFTVGDGSPARFWAAGIGTGRMDDDELRHRARFLAKLGVNMVRFHGSFSPRKKGAALTDVNQEAIENCWRTVASMKKEGIYTTISPFWANGGFAGVQASWGLEGYGDGQDIWGLIFFNDKLKEAYKGWMRKLYTTPNPHTGVPLAQEPAVALIQIQNEDSLLFFTMQAIKPPQKTLLERKFGEWLVKKHGTVASALRRWDGYTVAGDDPGGGIASIIDVWDMTQSPQGGKQQRLTDQTQFLGELQRGFYEEMRDFYRKELGCKQLINACNWKTASEAKLGDLERWTYDACDVIAVNKYYNGGSHLGPDSTWRINPADFFQSTSATQNPVALPTALKQNAGKPMIITESTWVHPLQYQSEGPFLMMAYQSLTGIDAYYWFSHDRPEYNLDPYHRYSKVDGQYGMQKWGLPPTIETMFPAAALAHRMGWIQRGTPVVVENRPTKDLWERMVPDIVEGGSYDPNRDQSFEEGKVQGSKIAPSAFLQGPVVVGFDSNAKTLNSSANVSAGEPILGNTGQISLQPKTGLCTVNSPQVQGACGFLQQAGVIRLGSVIIESKNEYATALAVSLDGKPIDQSSKVLLQFGTRMHPTGWKTEKTSRDGKEGMRVISTGDMPWRVEVSQATVMIKSAVLTKATTLDTAGFPRGDLPVERVGSAVKITLPRDAVWVVIE
ncbi:MAG: hypothetical protein R3F13_20730 [Prosthecobacter sp.]